MVALMAPSAQPVLASLPPPKVRVKLPPDRFDPIGEAIFVFKPHWEIPKFCPRDHGHVAVACAGPFGIFYRLHMPDPNEFPHDPYAKLVASLMTGKIDKNGRGVSMIKVGIDIPDPRSREYRYSYYAFLLWHEMAHTKGWNHE